MTDTTGITIEGDRQLRASLNRAGHAFDDLSAPNEKAANLVAAASRPTRKSGRLSRSLRGKGTRDAAVIESDLVYAGVQHDGWPARHIPAQEFVDQAAARTEPALLPIYEEAVDDVLATVKGIPQ